MPSMFPREDGGVARCCIRLSPRAAGVTAHVQKPSLDVLDVGGSGGCVWTHWGGWGYNVAALRARRHRHVYLYGVDESLA